ncbi:MAG: ACP S-malonyltransferase [Planctomycetota bacterium]|jgi:[acyl-carrier-protein] S-malonyltransferase
MTKRAMLFPGQGAQYPGMGKTFCETFPEADRLFDRANEVLGFDLKGICFNGSEEEVNRTDICQPGILTTSLAILEVLKERSGLEAKQFQGTAGLSLGEYTALVFAGTLDFEDAVDLVSKRGRFMQEDSEKHPSGMMTLIGAGSKEVDGLVEKASSAGVLVAANFLAPRQVAISGALEALDAAERLLKEFGIKRGIRLKVAGAFHSPFMQEGCDKLKAELEQKTFRAPKIPFASNVSGAFAKDPEEIKAYLSKQVTSPVLWSDTMHLFAESGVGAFFEPGPGKVLTGIIKKVDRSLGTFNLDDPQDVEAFMKGISEG